MPDLRAVRVFLEERHAVRGREIGAFTAAEIAPRRAPRRDGEAREEARELLGILARGDLYAPILEQDLRLCCLVRETLAEASPLADAVFALQALGCTPMLLARHGELTERFARPALVGEKMAAFAMTEPDTGSDVAAIRTTARPDGGEWVLDGRKVFISNAGIADFYTVFATVDPEQRGKGIACLVVPADAPGLEFVRAQKLAEPHPLGEIAFEGCRVPAGNVLAPPGEGFKLGLATLDRLRATVAAAACGLGARALAEALAHARTRRQFGKALAEHQLVQEKLARMAIDLAAARLLTYRAARERDEGADRVTLESSMAKAFATEAAQRIADDAIQILGGRGVVDDHPVERAWRTARALRIYEGTTEIQHLIVAARLLEESEGTAP